MLEKEMENPSEKRDNSKGSLVIKKLTLRPLIASKKDCHLFYI